MKMRDLGLTYEGAYAGISKSVGLQMEALGIGAYGPAAEMMRSNRTAIDSGKAELSALAALLISKGVITPAEYLESMRVALNEELARWQDQLRVMEAELR